MDQMPPDQQPPAAPAQPPSALAIDNAHRLDRRDIADAALGAGERIVGAALGKAGTWAISAVVMFAGLAISIGSLVWVSKGFILEYQKNSVDIARVQSAHEHCERDLNDMKSRMNAAEREISSLKASARTAGN